MSAMRVSRPIGVLGLAAGLTLVSIIAAEAGFEMSVGKVSQDECVSQCRGQVDCRSAYYFPPTEMCTISDRRILESNLRGGALVWSRQLEEWFDEARLAGATRYLRRTGPFYPGGQSGERSVPAPNKEEISVKLGPDSVSFEWDIKTGRSDVDLRGAVTFEPPPETLVIGPEGGIIEMGSTVTLSGQHIGCTSAVNKCQIDLAVTFDIAGGPFRPFFTPNVLAAHAFDPEFVSFGEPATHSYSGAISRKATPAIELKSNTQPGLEVQVWTNNPAGGFLAVVYRYEDAPPGTGQPPVTGGATVSPDAGAESLRKLVADMEHDERMLLEKMDRLLAADALGDAVWEGERFGDATIYSAEDFRQKIDAYVNLEELLGKDNPLLDDFPPTPYAWIRYHALGLPPGSDRRSALMELARAESASARQRILSGFEAELEVTRAIHEIAEKLLAETGP